jgi:hypothetical protein
MPQGGLSRTVEGRHDELSLRLKARDFKHPERNIKILAIANVLAMRLG